MSKSSPFLVEYYESADGADDLRMLAQSNPAPALDRRKLIVKHLNENFAALSVAPSERDLRDQARFAAGECDPRQADWLLRLYAYSIRARSKEALWE